MKKRREVQWTAYFDDRLSETERKEMEAQLEREPERVRDLEAWRDIRDGLHTIPEPDIRAADALWREVRQHLPAQEPVRPMLTHPAWMGALGTVAAAAMLALMVWTPWSGRVSGPASVEFVDARLPESVPVVYTDTGSGWTVVWLSNANLEETHETL